MDTLTARYNLAGLENRRRTPDEAAHVIGQLVTDAEANLPAKHHMVGTLRAAYARRLYDARRYAEAEPHAVRAAEELEAALGRSHATTRACANTVADIYEALEQTEKAAPYRLVADGK